MSNRTRQQALDKHHRRPSSIGGDGSPENISRVDPAKHRAYHVLFKNWEVSLIAEELNRKWIDTTYELVVVKRRK